jgi:outer membrane receptor protein involved in Fe transport
LIVGVASDSGRTEFRQSLQEAGALRDTASNAPVVLDTALHARSESRGFYASDTLALGNRTSLNLAGRYNDARVKLEDRLGTALNGHHRFGRFSPSIGATFRPRDGSTGYMRYEESMRTPTPVELTCADPAAPCSLPNAFAADPPLKPVVARTTELGARGGASTGAAWTAAVFRTDLDDDIQFISSGSASSAGYFQNVGRTRRQGVEVGIEAKRGPLTLSGHYSLVDATYRMPLVLASPYNSAASGIRCDGCREIAVRAGNRIPGIARELLNARAQYETPRWRFGLTLTAQSGQYARGDESNQDVNGPIPGSLRVHLDVGYVIAPRWVASARIDNLFDRRDASFATLGRNVFTGPDRSFDASGASWRAEQFRAVGAPRSLWIGLSYRAGPSQAP